MSLGKLCITKPRYGIQNFVFSTDFYLETPEISIYENWKPRNERCCQYKNKENQYLTLKLFRLFTITTTSKR